MRGWRSSRLQRSDGQRCGRCRWHEFRRDADARHRRGLAVARRHRPAGRSPGRRAARLRRAGERDLESRPRARRGGSADRRPALRWRRLGRQSVVVRSSPSCTCSMRARCSSLAKSVEGDEKTQARIRFAVLQWIDAAAPSNYLALNPEAQKKALETPRRKPDARPDPALERRPARPPLADRRERLRGRPQRRDQRRARWSSRTSCSSSSSTRRSRPRSTSGRSCSCRRASISSTSSTCSPRTR